MKYLSNNYAEFQSNIIENFSDSKTLEKYSVDELKKYLEEIKKEVDKKSISKDDLAKKVRELNIINKNKDTKDEIRDVIKKFVFSVRNYSGGMKLQGNLELGGVMTSEGYYLSDGSKLKEVEKIVDKLAVPIDKNGNINIVPKDKGIIKLHNRVNIGESNTKSGELLIMNPKNNNNPNGYGTSFNYNKTGNNYISGNTELKGTTTQKEGGIQIANPTGPWTYFNYKNKGNNFITGDTQINGKVTFDGNSEIIIKKNKSSDNPKGWSTTLNNQGRNFISGSTRFHSCPSFDVDSKKIILRGADNVNINGRSVDVRTDRFNVLSAGKTSSFGSQNSGWCHIMTTAPQFYMNKGLQVQGHIRGYPNQPINADKGVHAPQLSRIGGDWLRINWEGNSVGRTAMYGGVSINEDRNGRGGLGVGYWDHPGNGNIKATGKIEGKELCIVDGDKKYCITSDMMKKIKSKVEEKKENIKEIVDEKIKSVIDEELRKFKLELNTVKLPNNLVNTFKSYKMSKISDILSSKNYDISFYIRILNNIRSGRWKNVYHYGNSDNERAPALWLWPTTPWKIHFRVATNRSSNDGYDFEIPNDFRKYGIDINIRTTVKEQDNKVYITHYVNNKKVGETGILTGRNLSVLLNRTFYIKNPYSYSDRSGFEVKSLIIRKLN